MIDFIGWFGGILLSLCAIPQAYYCYKIGDARGLSNSTLLMWLFGEIFMLIYVIPTEKLPLILNYILNLLTLCVIIKYKYWERK